MIVSNLTKKQALSYERIIKNKNIKVKENTFR